MILVFFAEKKDWHLANLYNLNLFLFVFFVENYRQNIGIKKHKTCYILYKEKQIQFFADFLHPFLIRKSPFQ